MKKRLFLIILILIIALFLVYSGLVFSKNYKILVLQKGAENECEIKGITPDFVQVGKNLYKANEYVCGGRLSKIYPNKIIVVFNETEEEYKLGEIIARFSRLSLGMTKESVSKLAGEPRLIRTAEYDKEGKEIETWEYSELFKKGWEKKYYIYFSDNKVVKIKGFGF